MDTRSLPDRPSRSTSSSSVADRQVSRSATTSRSGRDFMILDERSRVGDGWRTRWDSLRLFTPAKYDGLPGMPFPGDRLAFPSKDEQADYLEAYAARFGLPVVNGIRVERVRRDDGTFLVEAGSRRWRARSVVLATGGSQVPFVPAFADRIGEQVTQLHCSDYRNPAQLRPGAVLVVGLGNSGAEIALELSADRDVLLAGEPVGELPFRHGRNAARFALPLIRFAGTRVLARGDPDRPQGGGAVQRAAADSNAAARPRRGGRHAGAADHQRRRRPAFAGHDGQALDVASVIWCTGTGRTSAFSICQAGARSGRTKQSPRLDSSYLGMDQRRLSRRARRARE